MNNSIRAIITVFFICIAAMTTADAETAPAVPTRNRPNVLFIAVDDLRPELGCYGVEYAQSPNIDALAESGVRFSHHYVQVPTCHTSRQALLTGRSPASPTFKFAYRQPDGSDAAASMPELFRKNGYRTICLGKISHQPDGKVYSYNGKGDGRDEVPRAWDALPTPHGQWRYGWGAFFAYANGKHREDGKGYRPVMEFIAEKDEDLPDGLIAKAAMEQIGKLQERDRPFFLAVGFYKPHLPFVATRGDWEAMENVKIPPPPVPEKIDTIWPGSGEINRYKKSELIEGDMTAMRRRAYLACVRFTDRQIGKVLNALDANGLADNTIVVVWGDHGWHLGDYGYWGKHTPLERALHSPLIIRAPALGKAGAATNALAESIDIFPTLIDLADLKTRETAYPLDGKSLRPALEDPSANVREAAISYWGNGVSVRTKTHRLIAKRDGEKYTDIELYDMTEGPDPKTNIAAAAPAVVAELKKHLP